MGTWKRHDTEVEPVLPVTPEELEQGREPADSLPVERVVRTTSEFNPYDNWPRYTQYWPETQKGE